MKRNRKLSQISSRKFFFFILVITLLFGQLSFSEETVSEIPSEKNRFIKVIEVPYSGGKAIYRYAVIDPEAGYPKEPNESEERTIVKLSGGPVANLLNEIDNAPKRYPKGVRIIIIEYRGFGVNSANFDLNNLDDFSTSLIAQDVLAVIRKVQPKNYILHGQSFGTLIATKVAAMAANEKLIQPKAVVLEGTVGSSPTKKQTQASLSFVSNYIHEYLPAEVFSWFKKDLVFDYDESTWGQIILQMVRRQGLAFTVQQLKLWYKYATQGTPEIINSLKETYIEKQVLLKGTPTIADEKKSSGNTSYEVQQKLLVTEIRKFSFYFFLRKGRLQIATFANNTKNFKQPYKAIDWQIPSSIYYFQGLADLDTPDSSAFKHFKSQTTFRTKQYLRFNDGGHAPSNNFSIGVRDATWTAIFENRFIEPAVFGESVSTFNSIDRTLMCRKFYGR